MSDNLPASVIKAMEGDYDTPVKRLWLETWRQLLQMPKTFWQSFGIVILVLFGSVIFMGLLVGIHDWFDAFVLHFNDNSVCVTLPLPLTLKFFFIAVIDILLILLTISWAFLTLQLIRKQTIKATRMLKLGQAWCSLMLIGVLFLLFHTILFYASNFFSKILYGYVHIFSAIPIFTLVFYLYLIIIMLLNTYVMLVFFMASLLILDQKMSLKTAWYVAFKSINQHGFKNITLLFLPSVAYLGACSNLINLVVSFRNGNFFYYMYIIFLPAMILTTLFILYKKIAVQANLSPLKKIALIILKLILGLVIVELFFSGVGLIWLLPVVSLLLAIQYQHIFLDNPLAYDSL